MFDTMISMSAEAYQLAQINIARMKFPLDDPSMADFVAQLNEVNALADRSPGFVWRLADDSGGAATDIRAFEDDRILVNMSVWESLEALRAFSYQGRHAKVLRDRGRWFESRTSRLVMWWVPAGTIPSIEDAKQKLELLESHGSTAEAFTFKDTFPPPP